MQLHLSSATPLSHSGKGDEREKKERSLPCIKLSLGHGGPSHIKVEEKEQSENSKSVFTAAQFYELHLQVVIFKYITSGLPVPFHLFFIIWNSVSTSLGSSDGGICKLYPSLGRFDYASMLDPEPGRCKRTDGKKWRCKRDVIPGQKYCEQHMHRGRRSRKPVEASEYVTKADDISITSKRTKLCASSDDPGSNFAPASTQTASLSSTIRNNQNNCRDNSPAKPSGRQVNHMTCNRKNDATWKRDSSFITGDAACWITRDRSNNADGKNLDSNLISPSIANQNRKFEDPRSYGGLVPVVRISARSDLRHVTETEPERCRRSDGKKWRCRRSVVPHRKYCETHMHRGAKRSSSYRFHDQAIPRNDDNGRNLNTSLSICTPPGPQNTAEDDSNSNSTSDATTITDEIPAFVMR